jgi:cytochrome c556
MSLFPEESDSAVETEEASDEAESPAEPTPSGRLPLAGGILLAVVAELFLGLALVLPGGPNLMLIEMGVPLISSLFALVSCLLVGMAMQGRERGAWVLLGLACLGMLVAQSARFVPSTQNFGLPLALAGSYPSVASLALITQSLGFFLAFLLFPPPTQNEGAVSRLRLFFDGALVIGTALVGTIYFILLPLVQETDAVFTPARLTTLAICTGDLLLLAGLVFALRAMSARRGPLSAALYILGLAMALLIGADVANMLQTPDQPAPVNSLLQAIWNAGYLCIGLGAVGRLRGGNHAPAAQQEASAQGDGSRLWLVLPFAFAVAMAGGIVIHAVIAATTSTQMLVALVCLSLLVALIGTRHLVGLFEARRWRERSLALEDDLARAAEEIEQARSSQLAQARARRESLERLQDALTRFRYGDYQVRVGVLERELAPLAEGLNALLDGIERQLTERDRGREVRLLRILADALGRLALGELHDLPDLPSPTGTNLDALMKGVIQIRTRLINLQSTVQQYEAERQDVQQQLAAAHQKLEEEAHAQHQSTLQMTQALETTLQSERQVAQAAEEQFQRERQRLQAQLQAAEARVQAAEATLHARDEALRRELEVEQRLIAERQALEERLRSGSQLAPASLSRLRQRGEQLVAQFTGQAERLHAAAATLQTAAEVAQRLARTIQETAALPEVQGTDQAAVPAAAQPPATPSAAPLTKPLSAMQMLERLAGLRTGDTASSLPVVKPALAEPAATPPASQRTGPLGETPGERVARRLHMAASRAEEIAAGLLDLATQCIAAGEESQQAAEDTHRFTADLEQPATAPEAPHRTALPARLPKSGR